MRSPLGLPLTTRNRRRRGIAITSASGAKADESGQAGAVFILDDIPDLPRQVRCLRGEIISID